MQTEFEFELPKGYVDANGEIHQAGHHAPGHGSG